MVSNIAMVLNEGAAPRPWMPLNARIAARRALRAVLAENITLASSILHRSTPLPPGRPNSRLAPLPPRLGIMPQDLILRRGAMEGRHNAFNIAFMEACMGVSGFTGKGVKGAKSQGELHRLAGLAHMPHRAHRVAASDHSSATHTLSSSHSRSRSPSREQLPQLRSRYSIELRSRSRSRSPHARDCPEALSASAGRHLARGPAGRHLARGLCRSPPCRSCARHWLSQQWLPLPASMTLSEQLEAATPIQSNSCSDWDSPTPGGTETEIDSEYTEEFMGVN
jgi:hypothetical protein